MEATKYELLSPDGLSKDEYLAALKSYIGTFDIHDGNLQSGYDENGKIMLRASSIKTFEDCQYKFYKQAIVKVGQSFGNSLASIIGTAIHYGVEMGIKIKINEPNCEPDTDYMLACGIEILENLFVTVDWTKEYVDMNSKNTRFDDLETAEEIYEEMEKSYEKARQIVVDGLYVFNRDIMPDITPTHAERRITWKFPDEHPVFSGLSGSIDIEEENSVRDVKVTGKKQRVDDHMLQLSTYAFLRQMTNEPIDLVYIDNVIKNKKIKAVAMYAEPDISRVALTINDIKEKSAAWHEAKQEKELTPEDEAKIWNGPRPMYFLCSKKWCDEYDTCPHVQQDEVEMFLC